MKIFRALLNTILILIIVGGLGYIAWNTYFMQYMGYPGTDTTNQTPMAPNTDLGQTDQHAQGNQHNMTDSTGNNALPNTIAIQNKDKLNQAIGTINQAIDLITIDPYSRTTMPSMDGNSMIMNKSNLQSSGGTGTINIYPSGSGSVNITPSGNITPNNQMPATDTNMGAMNPTANTNFVYDQGKLQQLHTGIYTLAQGLMLMHELNDDLSLQSAMGVTDPTSYQTQITKYNLALQNKTKLNNVISMIEQASILVNVNPYGAPGGYQINMDGMGQLHQGIFKLAQGMTLLGRLNDDFTTQMMQAAQQAQTALGTSNTTPHIGSGNMFSSDFLNSINISTIFSIILIVMVVSLLIGILGAIVSLFKARPRENNRITIGEGPQNDNS
ncbi:hypothetical protein [Anaerosolibacter carboniphilus]|uniref:hypothetical protein n=1 Tax=Anaerosolibacter carboniphilus TaxID=1417629 RepID=UPI00160D4DC8|nr:hypothetical protein [Anaerosolibacter carboniphilus]